MLTILDIITKTTVFFDSKGVPNPRLDAELLVGHALGLKRMQLYMQFERPLTEIELDHIRPLVRRRGAREPLQHILGTVEWGGLVLKTDRRALIPRHETEFLVELIINHTPGEHRPSRILDMGTGSGAIALALASHFPQAIVTALDASDDALALARENATALGLDERVSFVKSNWFSALPGPVTNDGHAAHLDLVVSNPPYLSDAEVDAAEPEVRIHDPRCALVAPDDGLADLRIIVEQAWPHLSPGGLLALETGLMQHSVLAKLAESRGYARHESLNDLTGRERFFFAWR